MLSLRLKLNEKLTLKVLGRKITFRIVERQGNYFQVLIEADKDIDIQRENFKKQPQTINTGDQE